MMLLWQVAVSQDLYVDATHIIFALLDYCGLKGGSLCRDQGWAQVETEL